MTHSTTHAFGPEKLYNIVIKGLREADSLLITELRAAGRARAAIWGAAVFLVAMIVVAFTMPRVAESEKTAFKNVYILFFYCGAFAFTVSFFWSVSKLIKARKAIRDIYETVKDMVAAASSFLEDRELDLVAQSYLKLRKAQTESTVKRAKNFIDRPLSFMMLPRFPFHLILHESLGGSRRSTDTKRANQMPNR